MNPLFLVPIICQAYDYVQCVACKLQLRCCLLLIIKMNHQLQSSSFAGDTQLNKQGLIWAQKSSSACDQVNWCSFGANELKLI